MVPIPLVEAGCDAAEVILVDIMDPQGDEQARISLVPVEERMLEGMVVKDGVAPSPVGAPEL